MRPDQIKRLEDLSQRVAEVLITEADPDNWNGAGVQLRDLDDKARGNRYWDKKNAVQTGALLARVLDLAERDSHSTDPNTKTPPEEAEADIKKYEKRAKELIRGIQQGVS